jgi:CBS domain-containing protein
MLVREVMTTDPVTATPETTIKEAISLLAKLGITAMPIVDRKGRLHGIVSEADLIEDVVPRDPRAHERPIAIDALYPPTIVEDVYTRAAVTVSPEDDVATAVEMMTATGAKSLPVVDPNQHVLGVISRSDIVKQFARTDAVIAADISQLLTSTGHDDWLVEVDDGVVQITGPANAETGALARVVARTVPGVVDVHVVDA